MKKLQLLLIVLLVGIQATFAQSQVTGRVTYSDDGAPVVGATIIATGTSVAVLSDIDGNYAITLPSGSKSLEFRYTGLIPNEIDVTSSGVYNVSLKSAALTGETVIVTGYGDIRSRNFAGSATVVSSEDTKDVPSISVADRLAGSVAGLTVTSTSGQPGSKESIRIRGTGSINAGSDPLIVLDGVPMNAGSSAQFSYDDAGMGLLATINPADIASMTVIKDAAAASLYGSRAANGVIVITTKKGSAGKTRFSVKADVGFSNPAIDWRPSLNGEDRREILELGLYNNGIYTQNLNHDEATAYASREINKYAKKPWSGYTDWEDVLFRQGFNQNYEVSAQGGNDKTRFYASLGYTGQNGLVQNQDFQRISGRLSVDHTAGIFTLGASTQFTNNKQEVASEGLGFASPYMVLGFTGSPSDMVYNEDGSVNITDGFNAINGAVNNPVWERELNYTKRNVNRAMNNINGKLDILDGLYVKQVLSYDYLSSQEDAWWDPRSGNGRSAGGVMQKIQTTETTLTSQTQINYSKIFAEKHSFGILGSFETEMTNFNYLYANGTAFPSYKKNEIENASIKSADSFTKQSNLMAYLAKVDYTYDNRLYLGGTFRRDGTSRLAPESRWGNFFSVSAYWRIAGESWFQDGGISNVLTDAKIRASFGENGTQPYDWNRWQGTYQYGYNYNNAPGLSQDKIENPYLKWERSINTNFGLDLTFIDRISVSLDLYNRDTKDLILNQSVSTTTGFSTILSNAGAMNNKGVEFSANFEAVRTKDVNWTIGLNLAHNKNTLKSLSDGQTQTIYVNPLDPTDSDPRIMSRVGESIYSFFLIEYAGVDSQTGEETWYKNTEIKDAQGNVTGYDRSLTSDYTKAEKMIFDNMTPYLTGGLTTRFNYKWFDLGLTLSFSLGGHTYDSNSWGYSEGGTYNYLGQVPAILDIDKTWRKPGDNAELPMFIYGNSNCRASTRFIESTDHLRLKNLSIGFSAPKAWTDKMKIQRLRIYASGQNVFTLKDKGLTVDPETPIHGVSQFEAPQMRSFTFGIELGF